MEARPTITDHQNALEATIEKIATQCAEAVEGIAVAESALLTGQPGWRGGAHVAQSCLGALFNLPRAEHFYLAQYYTDQHATAVRHQQESKYHHRLAEYWEAASSTINHCLAPALSVQSAPGDDIADAQSQYRSRDYFYDARQYERFAVGMCEDAVMYHGHAQRLNRQLNTSASAGSESAKAWLGASQAWENAAQHMQSAATTYAASLRLRFFNCGWKDAEARAVWWAELAEDLEIYAVALKARNKRDSVSVQEEQGDDLKTLKQRINALEARLRRSSSGGAGV